MSRAPDHILRDLASKTSEDVGAIVLRNAALVGADPQDLFYIALSATAAAAGLSIGLSRRCAPEMDADEAVDTLWAILRPMTLIAAGGSEASFQALLEAAPEGRTA